MPYVPTVRGAAPRFKVGSHVRFRLANQFVRGKIVECRGLLAGGKPLYRVEVPFNNANYLQYYELPESELKPA